MEYIRSIKVNKIRTLLRLRNFLPAETSLVLYKTTILPHMDYAALIWGSAGVTVIDELQNIQTKTLERLLKLKGLDDAALHKRVNVQFLDCKRNEQLLISRFNVLILGEEPFSNVEIKYNDHGHSTRAQQKDLLYQNQILTI